MLEYVSLFGAVACLVTFYWARSKFFVRKATTASQRQGLRPLGIIFGVGAIATLLLDVGARIRGFSGVALILFFISILLFTWTVNVFRGNAPSIAFTPGAPEKLILLGPFRYIRHPIYLAYILFWIGVLVASPSIFTATGFFVMLFLYIKAALYEEEEILASSHRENYLIYQSRVGMLFPAPWKAYK